MKSFKVIDTQLSNMVETEFKKKNSYLHENIEKNLSKLAAEGFASSGVAVNTIIELCINDLSERIQFIFTNLNRIIDAKHISYSLELHQDAIELVNGLCEAVKNECLMINSENFIKISKGSVEGGVQKIIHDYELMLKEAVGVMQINFDELKYKSTFTLIGWFGKHATALIIGIITSIVGAIITILVT